MSIDLVFVMVLEYESFKSMIFFYLVSLLLHEWSFVVLYHQVFQKRLPPEAVDLLCRFFQYSPNLRCTAVSDPWFCALRCVIYFPIDSGSKVLSTFIKWCVFVVGSLYSSVVWWAKGPKHSSSQWPATSSAFQLQTSRYSSLSFLVGPFPWRTSCCRLLLNHDTRWTSHEMQHL